MDRDGVITEERGYLKNADEMIVYDYSRECVQILHNLGYLVIVITNQSGVARGFFSEDELKMMNMRLINDTAVDAVYYCPHHPDGKIKKYRKSCDCRKPNIGLIEIACKEYDIDLTRSYFIGDRECDIKTGWNAGIKTILVRTGYGSEEEKKGLHSDYVVNDLRDAVNICMNINTGDRNK